jgi:ornithine cyclodeaminase
MEGSGFTWISAETIQGALSFGDATRAVRTALHEGLDPGRDLSRSIIDVSNGQVLLMPSEVGRFVGVKIATVAPNNPLVDRERIQGIYVLMDSQTLTPIAMLDGIALTSLRTAAVSAAAADALAPESVEHLVVFGSGPQAWTHVQALRVIRDLSRVTVVARHGGRARALAERIAASGIPASVGEGESTAEAQAIVCATTARAPLFDDRVPDDCVVIAVGSHEPDARELPGVLMNRSHVVVEDVAASLREAGDVILAVSEGLLSEDRLIPLRDVATGTVTVSHDRPRVFKSVGMSWEDLVVASAVFERLPAHAAAGRG